ncbi:MAG: DsbA family protein [Spirochaetaceae bacterium]|nr:DsbA family protein [Spirochaetaceae bacterium]
MSVVALLLSALTAWSDPAARIGGAEALSLTDLYAAAAPAIDGHEAALLRCQLDAERSRDEALQTILRDLVHARLRTMEAARLGLSAEALAAHIDEAVEPVTDAEVSAFHRERGITEPLAEIGPQIRAYLERQAVEDARAAAYAEMERRYAVAYLLEPLRVEVAAEGFPSHGPADAPVTIVEFSDFECPYCARLAPVLDEVKGYYDDTVRVVYRHYPLSGIHPDAWKAAEASLCAHQQGRFWEFHDLLFADQGALSAADLKAKAERLDLDAESFGECLDSGRRYDAVLADVRAGDAAGVSGTPAMFVNGRFVGGAVPFATLAELIEDELRRAAQAAKAKKS